MTGRRKQNHWLYIMAKDEFIVIRPVKQKIEIDFGMRLSDAPKRFISEETDTLQFIFYKKPRIYGYALSLGHNKLLAIILFLAVLVPDAQKVCC
jgi:hypothetical protein